MLLSGWLVCVIFIVCFSVVCVVWYRCVFCGLFGGIMCVLLVLVK